MSDNIFDKGYGISRPENLSGEVRRQLVDGSPVRDSIIKRISQLSDEQLERLYKLTNLAKETGDYRVVGDALREMGISDIFPFTGVPSSRTDQESITMIEFHIGARRRARTVQRTLGDYYTKINEGFSSGDTVYMTNSKPCAKFNESKSPYERFRQIWENTEGNIAKIIDGQGNLKVDLSFLPEGTRQRAEEFLKGSARPPSTWESGIFDKERLPDGMQVPVNLGTENGSFARNEEYQKASNFKERKEIANDGIYPLFVPDLAINSLENAIDADFNPLDSNGDVAKNSSKVKKISPEYAELILEYIIEPNIQEIQTFIEDLKKFKDLTPEEQAENPLYLSQKRKFLLNVMSVLSGAELIKQIFEAKDYSHSAHTIAKAQGYVEIIANLYKTIYYWSHGDKASSIKQMAIGTVSAMSEFGWPNFAQEVLEQLFPGFGTFMSRSGGYVGLTISYIQFYHEFVTKPKYAFREFALKNELLDLERQMIEDECCTKIHPNLYRKTGGQMIILMTEDEWIPMSREYSRTPEGTGNNTDINAIPYSGGSRRSQQSGPCNSNGQIPLTTGPRFIKYKSAFEDLVLPENLDSVGTTPARPSAKYILDPREDEDPCKTAKERKDLRERLRKKREIIVRPQEGGSDNEGLSSNDYVPDKTAGTPPFWSETQEKMAQDASAKYNTDYITDIFKFKIEEAKTRTGETDCTSDYTAGPLPDRDGYIPLAGQSGMTDGNYRIGFSIIEKRIMNAYYEQATTDFSALSGGDTSSRRISWTTTWDIALQDYGFGVGGGSGGSGGKGITSFGWYPGMPIRPQPKEEIV